MRISEEQEIIAGHAENLVQESLDGSSDERGVIHVQAVAGSGKSLLIVELSRRLSHANFLFLSQSRNIADRAKQTLPNNVTANTISEMARRYVQTAYSEKIEQHGLTQQLTPKQVMGFTGEGKDVVHRTLQTLKRFRQSKDNIPEVHHVSLIDNSNDVQKKRDGEKIVRVARDIWFSQIKREGSSLPLTLDTAVKLWTQSQHSIGKELGLGQFDMIIVEEAQDFSEAIMSFLMRQRAHIVLLGDAHQMLHYQPNLFQVNDNNLRQNNAAFVMKDSWRFGQPVADLLAGCMKKSGASDQTRIVGLGESGVYGHELMSSWEGNGIHYTYIARNVATLFKKAVELSLEEKPVAWIDGLRSYPIHLLLDLVRLDDKIDMRTEAFYFPWVAQARSLRRIFEHAKTSGREDIASLCELVRAYRGGELGVIFEKLLQEDDERQEMMEKGQPIPERAVTLTTVARAKGHEFERVSLAEDLVTDIMLKTWHLDPKHWCAMNHLYTAISRAQRLVVVPSCLLEHMERQGHPIVNDCRHPKKLPHEQAHPYFGVGRAHVLEMSPGGRSKRKTVIERRQSTRTSGQTKLKEKIEEEAKALAGITGVEALRAALRS